MSEVSDLLERPYIVVDGEEVSDTFNWNGAVKRKASRAHVIADIRYPTETGPCWSTCSCGAAFAGDTPDDLAAQWTAHGGKAIGRMTPPKDRRERTRSQYKSTRQEGDCDDCGRTAVMAQNDPPLCGRCAYRRRAEAVA